jgi:biotin carboxyl carrier protein
MPVYCVRIEGRDYTVEVADPDGRPVRAVVDGYVVEVEAVDQRLEAADERAAVAAPVAAGPQATRPVGVAERRGDSDEALTVAAPLPGTIVSIGVAEGERVEHGQELCVLEAMKMNNPIRATRSGLVKEVLISVGQQVQHGQTLLVMVEV